MEFRRSSKFFNVFLTINSKSHEPDVIFSASIFTFSCGSNGVGLDIQFLAIFIELLILWEKIR